MTRLLTIMGSGETAPTMVKVHRRLLERIDGPAVLLDTPYGFQENADQISERTQDYFAQSVGADLDVASWRSAQDEPLVRERALARIAEAGYVFAGPGSPTYALDQWRDTSLPGLLADKLRRGGAVTFASAAALTLGRVSVPVYEIYKVGQRPQWVDGLDLLAELDLPVAVIPHYDNAEGGNHDTRFCYLGERRLRMLEAELPEGVFVLGVDEHTGLILDLDTGQAEVVGNGVVTVRRHGESLCHPAGTTLSIDDLSTGRTTPTAAPRDAVSAAAPGDGAGVAPPSLFGEAERLESTFLQAISDGNVDGAVAALLELDQAIVDWSMDTTQSDETDRARAVLRRCIVRLGEIAVDGARDPRTVVGPFVEAALSARTGAREAQHYALADDIRDALVAAGIEVRDTADGTDWVIEGD